MSEIDLLSLLNTFYDDYLSFFCKICIKNILNKAYLETNFYNPNVTNQKKIEFFLDFIIKYVSKLSVRCKNSEIGCLVLSQYKDIRLHESSCKYTTISCSICNGYYSYSNSKHICYERVKE